MDRLPSPVFETRDLTSILYGEDHYGGMRFDRRNPAPARVQRELPEVGFGWIQSRDSISSRRVPQFGSRIERPQRGQQTIIRDGRPLSSIRSWGLSDLFMGTFAFATEFSSCSHPKPRQIQFIVSVNGSSIGTEPTMDDLLTCVCQNGNRLRRQSVPKSCGTIRAKRQQRFTIGTEGVPKDRLPVVRDRRQQRGKVLPGGKDRRRDEFSECSEVRTVRVSGRSAYRPTVAGSPLFTGLFRLAGRTKRQLGIYDVSGRQVVSGRPTD